MIDMIIAASESVKKDASDIFNLIVRSTLTLDTIQGMAKHTLLCLLANAMHRHQTEGHNFIDHALVRKDSVASKVCSIAGSDTDSFREFMRIQGHDLFHLLSTESITDIANALTGVTNVKLENELFGKKGEAKFVYQVITFPAAAIDRWPPGVVGISSVILGIPLVICMAEAMDAKGMAEDAETIVEMYTVLLKLLKENTKIIDRELLLKIRETLGSSIALALGFNERYSSYDTESHKSMKLIVANYNQDYLTGLSIGTLVKKKVAMDVDVEAAAKKRLRSIANIGDLMSAIREARVLADKKMQPVPQSVMMVNP